MLTCSALEAGYAGKSVLQDINLTVQAGEIVGLLGANGSGKSTLLLCLSGFLQPLRGTVKLEGILLSRYSAKERAQKIACVPQRPTYIPDLTVQELTLMGRYPHLSLFSHYSDKDTYIAQQAMAETGVLHLANKRINEISGGELQRAFLACALAQKTHILLLDEATAGLDLARSMEIFTVLRSHAAKQKNTPGQQGIVAAIHDLNLAALFCDRLVFLKQGRIVAEGPVHVVFTRECLEYIYETSVTVFTHPTTGCPQMLPCPKAPSTANTR